MRASPFPAKALLCLLIGCPVLQPAGAASIEKLIMPGPVTQAHAKLESDCGLCHDRSDREAQRALCLDCHKEIAGDIRTSTRYHGRMSGAAQGQCRGCHTEHLGRSADINKLSPTGFSHELSEFPLRGAHAPLACVSCHAPAQAYRKTPTSCAGCHRKQDVHRGNLGSDCAACHEATDWTASRFDHDSTRFPLTNKHQTVSCAACHAGEHYKGTPQRCLGCHQPDDVHRGSQGSDCGSCHTTADWSSRKFDHAHETGFALLGRHARISCAACHRSGDLHAALPKDCRGCHSSDDRHAGRLGTSCDDCHGNDVWKVADFGHGRRFNYPLQGAHASIDCHACHSAVASEQHLGTACADCHRATDSHGGKLGAQCEQCHTVTRWQEVRFDHDLTDYPLTGLHVMVSCAQCHLSQRFNDAARDCHGCHARDDAHAGALGEDCAQCHSPNGWKQWDFDHAAHTRFPLLGAHARVGCPDCHLRPQNRVKPSMVCGTCHAADDIHQGRFGPNCQQCHETGSFRRPRTR